jgi:hypothetical protein
LPDASRGNAATQAIPNIEQKSHSGEKTNMIWAIEMTV